MAPLVREDSGHVAVAVADLTTGAQAAYGGSEEFVTASIVKVDILATLLYQLQQAGQVLTFQEQKLAVTMIENSDNDSASDLFDGVNRAEGVDDANRVFGLQQTAAGTRHWGRAVDDQTGAPPGNPSVVLASSVRGIHQDWLARSRRLSNGQFRRRRPRYSVMAKYAGCRPDPGDHQHPRIVHGARICRRLSMTPAAGIAVVEAVARAAAASITASWQDRHDRRAQELHVQVGRWRPRRARERCMLTANLLAGRCGGESHQAARS